MAISKTESNQQSTKSQPNLVKSNYSYNPNLTPAKKTPLPLVKESINPKPTPQKTTPLPPSK